MNGHHIALILNTFRDERLCPGDISDFTILLTRAEACREHQHVVIALETRLHHCWEITTLTTRLVNGNADRSQSWEIHQQVIDQITETPIVMTPDDGTQSDPVLTSKRMIADKSIETPILRVGQILLTLNLECHIQISDALFKPFHTYLVTTFPKEGVHLILMDSALEPVDQELWYKLSLSTQFSFQDLVNVDGLFCYCCHSLFLTGGKVTPKYRNHQTSSGEFLHKNYCCVLLSHTICNPRNDEISKLKLNLKNSGELWWKVGKNTYLCT